jgi:hypothetical protein
MLEELVAEVPPEQIPALIVALAARLLAQPAASNGTGAPAVPLEPDVTLDVAAIAALLKKSPRWVWRNKKRLPLRRVGRGLIASRRELEKWIAGQRVK